MHLLGGAVEVEATPAQVPAQAHSAREDRIGRLEDEVATLKETVARLEQQLAEFRRQFE